MSGHQIVVPSGDGGIRIRSANHEDLPELFRLTLDGLGATDSAKQVSGSDFHPFHLHALKHGRVCVATSRNRIEGYGSVIERDGTRILSQLFVREDARSTGIGRLLLNKLDPADGSARGLSATSDPRAVALYIRHGYIPAWPVLRLNVDTGRMTTLSSSAPRATIVTSFDKMRNLDRKISGRDRTEDFTYWMRSTGGKALVVEYGESPVGFGWVHDPLAGNLANWYEAGCPLHIGPVGALNREHSADVVLAILLYVRSHHPGRGATIEIGGPNPALPVLLRLGAQIDGIETSMFTDASRFGDPEQYVPSGGILL